MKKYTHSDLQCFGESELIERIIELQDKIKPNINNKILKVFESYKDEAENMRIDADELFHSIKMDIKKIIK